MVQREVDTKQGMKSDAFDTTYAYSNSNGLITSGYSNTNFKRSSPQEVEVVIKALGTMVIINKEKLNPATMLIEDLDPAQEPILLGKERDIVKAKLVELIQSL